MFMVGLWKSDYSLHIACNFRKLWTKLSTCQSCTSLQFISYNQNTISFWLSTNFILARCFNKLLKEGGHEFVPVYKLLIDIPTFVN